MALTAGRTGRPASAVRPPGGTKQRLLESATVVFATRGFESASMDAIADGAGVTSAAVYRHFHNKSDLRISVVERAIDSVPLSERLRGDTTRSVSDFSDLIAAYVDPALSTVPRQG